MDEREILYESNPDPVLYDAFLKNAMENSTFQSGIDLTKEKSLVILSTCSQEQETTRYVLICRVTPIEY